MDEVSLEFFQQSFLPLSKESLLSLDESTDGFKALQNMNINLSVKCKKMYKS